MCGIAGIFDRARASSEDQLQGNSQAMARVIEHRGPDDEGIWTDAAGGVALCQRRLAIIDCSPAGHQPMVGAGGRFVITYNGEIYNYQAIAEELKQAGCPIVGGSDTAIILAGFAHWGVEETVKKCVGMFAFILWDNETRTITLARDRMGIKPLHWGQIGELFLFGSQIKSVRAHERWDGAINRDALLSFVGHAYVPAPLSIFGSINKLEPGHILVIPPEGEPEDICYWNLREHAHTGAQNPFRGSYEEACDHAEALISASVHDCMIADVPLGAFLSGGVDSSTVVALMQTHSDTPVKTFSIGFREQQYDESAYAKAVAQHLGTDHTELFVAPQQALDLIPDLPTWYDEPFADSSQLPTLLLSKLTREHVTVALSGDGGDEVFAGYNRYAWADRIWGAVGWMPQGVRRTLACMSQMVPPGVMNNLASAMPGNKLPHQLGDKIHKAAGVVGAASVDDIYRRLIRQWPDPDALVIGANQHQNILNDSSVHDDRPDTIGRMQLLDMATYLPDDILTKVDRASMAFSLEARVPLIDHRIVEFAWSLPRDFMIRGGKSKAILRDVLYKHVPSHLIERPKMGFGVPIDTWLRGPLRDWAEALLSEARLKNDGFFNAVPIRAAWQRHCTGTRNEAYGLWTVLMFQSWLDCNKATS